ncbi:MAG: MotA/TolQ/ExbB proton channel family protein [Minwuia sp.]|nr:MotA/TolQ/ExbB proton channel family protein [Minwuia sp.]
MFARFDFATLIGLVASVLVVGSVIWLGDGFTAFLNLPSLLIVFGGTLAVTLISYPLGDVLRALPAVISIMFRRLRDPSEAAMLAVKLADEARRHGHLALPARMQRERNEPFLRKAMQLVVDDIPTQEIERILTNDMGSQVQREKLSAAVLHRAGEIAPAMGLIGTLLGLVQMLGRLDNPTEIGPAMALALLTTLYGAILANMVLHPLATKLEHHAEEEATLNRLYAAAARSISCKENPRHLEALINSLLPPLKRVRYYAA